MCPPRDGRTPNIYIYMKQFELEIEIAGQNAMSYMANLIEKNEKNEIEVERGKLSVSVLKQMNNRSRLLLDAAKFELKTKEFELEQLKRAKAEA